MSLLVLVVMLAEILVAYLIWQDFAARWPILGMIALIEVIIRYIRGGLLQTDARGKVSLPIIPIAAEIILYIAVYLVIGGLVSLGIHAVTDSIIR